MTMRSFGSDNHSGIHPAVLAALTVANRDHEPAYGDDPATARVAGLFRTMFGEQCDPYLVFNGTGANVFALRTLTRPYHAVICARTAHINVDECGAPEAHTGCKLLAIDTPDGKLTPDLVAGQLHGFGFQHHSQPKVVSISQPTEVGTLYSVEEIRALADQAHAHGMYLHVDGARFANAVAALGVTPRAMITDAGVDALSFGGTKNGMMLGEAVIFLNRQLSEEAMYQRKQLMQLASKMRFVAAQFEAYLHDDLWLRMASHANEMAALLADGVKERPGVQITQPLQANGVFATLPPGVAGKLRENYYFYDWDETRGEVRWMCSWDTTREDIEGFISALKTALEESYG